MARTHGPAVLIAALVALSACAPRLSPPYRDYQPVSAQAEPADRTRVLTEAAAAAGWSVAPSLDPAIVSTAPRRVASSLLSRTDASVDLVPLAGGFVRVAIRAEKRSTIFRSRSKVYALSPRLRDEILGELTAALRDRGLVPLGTPRDRDEDATE